MTKPTNQQIREFILDALLHEPHLLPKTPDRYCHAGTIWCDYRDKSSEVPAHSRVQKAMDDLTRRGLLRVGRDPDYNLEAWFLSESVADAFNANLVNTPSDLLSPSVCQALKLKMYGVPS